MLAETDSVQLSGWLEYLKLDDEMKVYQVVRAIILAFKKDDE